MNDVDYLYGNDEQFRADVTNAAITLANYWATVDAGEPDSSLRKSYVHECDAIARSYNVKDWDVRRLIGHIAQSQ